MKQSAVDISIVIVNYKVKEYIANLLNSIHRAKGAFRLQIIVIDNNSGDDSIAFLKQRFPEVHYIENEENVGFGKANNQGFKIAEGTYTLIINPDTLVSEDTFSTLVNHMEHNPDCGACGCKILNPDGSYAPESKRCVPSLSSSLYKVLGLTALFPKHRWFGEYYMGWLPEDEINPVPVLSGSFMLWRTDVLKTLGGFDERFFMYGEDIDLCYRIQQTNYRIDYVPTTSIIHYKGESTRKGDLKYVRIFNRALYQFFEKHYSSNYSRLFRGFIVIAIALRAVISFIGNNLRMIGFIASDLILLNLSVILGFLIRFRFSYEVVVNLQSLKYLWINLLACILYVGVGATLDLFQSQKNSISNQLKAIVGTYTGVAVVTFFVRNLAFSRLALIYGLAVALILMIAFRLVQINLSENNQKISGKLKRSKILLVGTKEDTTPIKQKIHSRPDWNYEVVGTVSIDNKEGDYLGTLSQITDLIRAYNIDQVFFALKSVSYKSMFHYLLQLQQHRVVVKLIPDSMDFILGKSNVEYLETIPIVEVGFAHAKGLNPFLKRGMDVVAITPIFVALLIVTVPGLLLNMGKREKTGGLRLFTPVKKNKWKNRTLLAWYVLRGTLSLVGAPIYQRFPREYEYKPGLTGLLQLNADKIQTKDDSTNYELYYLQNYSIWMDIDILLKSVFNGFDTLNALEQLAKKGT